MCSPSSSIHIRETSRTTQNWIGSGAVTLARATFVPSPAAEMRQALDNFEQFPHEEHGLPVLILCGLAHAQFETIHPFLYLSTYLKYRRAEYYDRLMAVRHDGNWEGWLRFFLQGVAETAEEATGTARAIVQLRDQHRELIQEHRLGLNELLLLDLLFQRPLVNTALVSAQLNITDVTAARLLNRLAILGLVDEITGRQRNRVFRYTPYWRLFQEPEVLDRPEIPVQSTESES